MRVLGIGYTGLRKFCGLMDIPQFLDKHTYIILLKDIEFSLIGDGDSKTHSGIVKAAPYDNITVNKKECIGHVQKRMGTRLCAVKKKQVLEVEVN
ncbi:uncharacterized protein [Euwallacea similis]|uniref:uncharacterized protein n=1 Tax=Euwallacea similis TaxID=1736056 RepID=UPI00344CE70A